MKQKNLKKEIEELYVEISLKPEINQYSNPTYPTAVKFVADYNILIQKIERNSPLIFSKLPIETVNNYYMKLKLSDFDYVSKKNIYRYSLIEYLKEVEYKTEYLISIKKPISINFILFSLSKVYLTPISEKMRTKYNFESYYTLILHLTIGLFMDILLFFAIKQVIPLFTVIFGIRGVLKINNRGQ